MIQLIINGNAVEVEEQLSVLEAVRGVGVKIPTLCYNKHLRAAGACRLCMVEMALEKNPGQKKLIASCCTTVETGMIIDTETARVQESRKFVLAMLLARCPDSRELLELAGGLGLNPENPDDPLIAYLLKRTRPAADTNCILCGLCVRTCAQITERHAISFSGRGILRKVKTPFNKYADTCIGCGACAYVCPSNTITIEEVP